MVYIIVIVVAIIPIKAIIYIIPISKNWIWIPSIIIARVIIPIPRRIIRAII
jgi:hypothetical protein